MEDLNYQNSQHKKIIIITTCGYSQKWKKKIVPTPSIPGVFFLLVVLVVEAVLVVEDPSDLPAPA